MKVGAQELSGLRGLSAERDPYLSGACAGFGLVRSAAERSA